jgi:alkanesulfonate monooxygenase SsuD/methylene tetrahydromethanopterin reductase-like flavin-dependent oxidoreductase (luciferase family)
MDKERSGERMKLGAFFHPTGNHVAAWMHPDAQIDAGTNFRHYAEITQTAERGKFDLMFVADAVATRDGKRPRLAARWQRASLRGCSHRSTLLPARRSSTAT